MAVVLSACYSVLSFAMWKTLGSNFAYFPQGRHNVMYALSAWSEQLSELLKLHIPAVIMRQEEGAFPAPGRCPRCLSQGAYSPCSNPGGTGLAIDQFHLYSDLYK